MGDRDRRGDVTCPRCKNVLPCVFPRQGLPKTGDALECGMCGHLWRFRMPDDEKEEAMR